MFMHVDHLGRRIPSTRHEKPGGEGGGGTEGEKPLTMTQAQLDEIIEKRLARERAKFEKAGVSAEERQELERHRQAEKDRERKEAEKKGEYERVIESVKTEHEKALQAEKERAEKLRGELKKDRCERAIITAAAAGNAYKAEHVAILLRDRVILDDEHNVVVLGEDGKPAYRAGKPLTVDAFVSEYLAENPHLVKAGNTDGGSGSKGGRSTSPEGAVSTNPTIRAKEEEVEKLEEEAAKGSTSANQKLLRARRELEALRKKAA